MTRILAIDTSTDACSVAYLSGEECVERFELAAQSHTRRLLPMVDSLLAEVGVGLSQLDAIAFSRGPGSFTGLRIGFGTVQGLAFATELPVLPVSTLMAIAEHHYSATGSMETPLLIALDARMQEVYWCLYSGLTATGLPAAQVEEAVSPPEQVREYVQQHHLGKQLVGLGSGWEYTALAQSAAKMDSQVYPRAASVARLGYIGWQQGQAQAVESVQLTYLRDQVSWQKRERIRQR